MNVIIGTLLGAIRKKIIHIVCRMIDIEDTEG